MTANASYDKALLDDAPEVTPHQRQRFYDADLLYDDSNRAADANTNGGALPPGAAPAAVRSTTDLEAGHGGPGRNKEYTSLPPPSLSKTPWYKTRNGVIALVILAIVVVGAVVGGAVGGTQANKSSSKDAEQSTSSGSNSGSNSSSSSSVSLLGPTILPSTSSVSSVTETGSLATQGVGVGTGTPSSTQTVAPIQGPSSDSEGVQTQAAVQDTAALVAAPTTV